jgi:CRISPR-associated protein Cas1
VVSEGDFRREKDGGARLTEAALKRYLEHFQRRMEKDFLHPEDKEEVSFRAIFRLQAERLEKAVLEGVAYQPFLVQ